MLQFQESNALKHFTGTQSLLVGINTEAVKRGDSAIQGWDMAHFNPGSRYHHELPCKINGNGKWQSCSTAPLTALSVSQPYFFLTSGANFQKTQPPPNLSLLISPAGTCQQPGQHTACRKRRERINEDCFRREQFSPRINLSWKCSLYEAPFPLLKGHPALLQEAPCFFLNALLWDTSLFLPQICGFIQSKKSDGKKKKKSKPNLQLPLKPK